MTRLRLPLALLALATTAHAQRITYRFTGEVTQISDFLAAPWDETVLGDPIELVCEVDPLSNQITSPDLPGLVVYGDSVRQITFAIGDSEITTSEANPTILSLQNDDPFTPACADSLFINTTIPGGLGLIVFLQVQGTPCPDVFTDNSIPTQLDLSDFDTRYIYLAIDGANLRASIDSVTISSSTGDNVLFETCFGDGGPVPGCTPCPCSNEAAQGTFGGCLNEFGASARLTGIGSHSVVAGDGTDLRFGLEGSAPGSFAVLVSGANVAPANVSNPCFGQQSGVLSTSLDGLRCVSQAIVRHGSRATNGGGAIELLENGWSGASGIAGGLAAGGGFGIGQARSFQAFYRTSLQSACGTGQNTSQALSMTFTP